MHRKAFLMFLDPGQRAEYKRRHDEIWPELVEVLVKHGVRTYSIYHDSARDLLFGYVEVESLARWEEIASTRPCREWWAFMQDVMHTHPDHRPVSLELEEVFHLDAPARP